MMNEEVNEIKKQEKLGAWAAVQKAREYGTKLAVLRQGKLVLESPDEFERYLKDK